jgi:hypothetical protein
MKIALSIQVDSEESQLGIYRGMNVEASKQDDSRKRNVAWSGFDGRNERLKVRVVVKC